MIIPYDDPNLLNAHSIKDVAISPFVLIFKRAGLGPAEHVVNAVILTTVVSAGNSGLYACTRMLHAMAMAGTAPRLFSRCTRRGVPIYALVFVLVIAIALFGISFIGNQRVFSYILNISTLMGLITWLSILLAHVRFRLALKRQGYSTARLPFRDWTFPFGTTYAACAIMVPMAGTGWAQTQGHFDVPGFITTYLGPVIACIMYCFWKWYKKTRILDLAEIDLISGSVEDSNYLSSHHVD
ncbi:hypothetical protein EC988_005885 [Linderina pennispora]|nr:hypothetical protein EC988_005885 [Linderina pennispora]